MDLPLRSLLFVPGNKEAWMRKASGYGPDALIFDLEDAVPAGHRAMARGIVREVLRDLGGVRPALFVRVNGLETGETGDDLEAVVCPELHGVLLPKVAGPSDLIGVGALLDHFERRGGVPVGRTRVMPLLETATSVRLAYEIGTASPRVAYLGYGAAKDGDGTRSIGYEWTPEGTETLYLRSRILADARAAGVRYPVSGLWTLVPDLDGLRAFARQTRQIGYTGMLCIHPSHVPVINEVFSPTAAEIADWRAVIARLEAAERSGTTAIQHEGHLIDTAMVKTARERLAAAARLGLVEGEEEDKGTRGQGEVVAHGPAPTGTEADPIGGMFEQFGRPAPPGE
jgi:citrate lyase subunit beta/citryl-CoA lyase